MRLLELEIIYHDKHLVAINKPHGLLVHRTSIASDAGEFAMQLLRNQLGRHVFPAHRLDRKTGGVLLFSLDQETNRRMQSVFATHQIVKTYYAIVRGYLPDQSVIDYPLKREDGSTQKAITRYVCLERTEIPVPFGKHTTSRYSFAEITPETGRMHQIRKHFAHIFHPIIGDRPYGCNKQNRLFKNMWDMNTMLLHASTLQFDHPWSGKRVIIHASLQPEFSRMTAILFKSGPDKGSSLPQFSN